MVLNFTGLGQRGVGEQMSLSVVEQEVHEASSRATVGPIDGLVVPLRRFRPLTRRHKKSVVADQDHSFRLAGVALDRSLGDELPLRRPPELQKQLNDLASVGACMRRRQLVIGNQRPIVVHSDIRWSRDGSSE